MSSGAYDVSGVVTVSTTEPGPKLSLVEIWKRYSLAATSGLHVNSIRPPPRPTLTAAGAFSRRTYSRDAEKPPWTRPGKLARTFQRQIPVP